MSTFIEPKDVRTALWRIGIIILILGALVGGGIALLLSGCSIIDGGNNPPPSPPPPPPPPAVQSDRVIRQGSDLYYKGEELRLLAFSSWSINTLPDNRMERWVAWARSQGFNCILMGRPMGDRRDLELVKYTQKYGMWLITACGVHYYATEYPWKGGIVSKDPYGYAKAYGEAALRAKNIVAIMTDAYDLDNESVAMLGPGWTHDKLANELMRGLKDSTDGKILLGHFPKHGKIVVSDDLAILHSGHSQGQDPAYVRNLYSRAQGRPTLNVEPPYFALTTPYVHESVPPKIAKVDAELGDLVVWGDIRVVQADVDPWNAVIGPSWKPVQSWKLITSEGLKMEGLRFWP